MTATNLPRSPWRQSLELFRRDRVAMASAVFIASAVAIACLAPILARLTGHGPAEPFIDDGLTAYGIPVGPCRQFWMGCDGLGRDLLVRLAYGARVSLVVGVLASALAAGIGTVFGLVAGWYGGLVDGALVRLMDTVLALPFLILALALAAVVGPGIGVSILVIAFFSWASIGRVVRAETLGLRDREFVIAARSMGAGSLRIIFRDLLPVVSPTVIVYGTMMIPAAIGFEAALSFLGLGIPAPTPSWGGMLSEAMSYYRVAWWMLLFPGLALFGLSLAFNLLGDGIRDVLDPRRAQRQGGAR